MERDVERNQQERLSDRSIYRTQENPRDWNIERLDLDLNNGISETSIQLVLVVDNQVTFENLVGLGQLEQGTGAGLDWNLSTLKAFPVACAH
jgi:hypothetical protein